MTVKLQALELDRETGRERERGRDRVTKKEKGLTERQREIQTSLYLCKEREAERQI